MLGNSHSSTACSINSETLKSWSKFIMDLSRRMQDLQCYGGKQTCKCSGTGPKSWFPPWRTNQKKLGLGWALDLSTGTEGCTVMLQSLQSIPEKVSQMFFQICLNLIFWHSYAVTALACPKMVPLFQSTQLSKVQVMAARSISLDSTCFFCFALICLILGDKQTKLSSFYHLPFIHFTRGESPGPFPLGRPDYSGKEGNSPATSFYSE